LNVRYPHDRNSFNYKIFKIEIMAKTENKIYNGDIVAGSLLMKKAVTGKM